MMTYQEKAKLFQALAHPIRLQILEELHWGEACVCHLQVVTGRSQTYISQQLRVLRDKGLVTDNKVGQNVFYQLKNEQIHQILDIVQNRQDPIFAYETCNCPKCVEKGKGDIQK